MIEKDRITSTALAACYIASAVVIVALYREPISQLCGDIGRWLAPRFISARSIPGKLGIDVREALDNAG